MPAASEAPSFISRTLGSIGRFLRSPIPALPNYPGPYGVSFIDHEHIIERRSSSAEATHPDSVPKEVLDVKEFTAVHPVKSLNMRVYFPTDPTFVPTKWAGWLPEPAGVYGGGYAHFLGVNQTIGSLGFPALLAFTSTPDRPGAPLLSHPDAFPVVIFSHGLGGNRSTYTHICGTLASHGFVVAALEHTEGSASTTVLDRGRYHVPYRRPPNKGLTEEEMAVLRVFRGGQVQFRADEVTRCVGILDDIAAGTYIGGLEPSEPGIDWKQFAGKLDVNNMAVAGHSFGAATSLGALAPEVTDKTAADRYRCGIVLDAWMFSLPRTITITHPLLSINSSAFHWRANLVRLHALFPHLSTTISEAERKSHFLTQPNTAHQNHSDFPLLLPNLMAKIKMSGTAEPIGVARVQNRAILGFLRGLMPGSSHARAIPEAYEGYLLGKVEPGEEVTVSVHGDAVLPLEEAEAADKKDEGVDRHQDRIDEEVDESDGNEYRKRANGKVDESKL